MNLALLQNYIKEYENHFAQIHDYEIYKWRAVKQFQDSWKPDASEFMEMLSKSLSKTGNLMESGNYFPRRVILRIAEKKPQLVKAALIDLFVEDTNVIMRIEKFREQMEIINSSEFPGSKHFQDHRATLVYLTLRYPDTYFFYKFKMLKSFCEKIEYDYKPSPGVHSNILQFLHLCTMVREELIRNNNLIKLHKDRIGVDEYFDVSFNILTQDFIYAVTRHLTSEAGSIHLIQHGLTMQDIRLEPISKEQSFKGRYVDFISQHKVNKQTGDLGEQLVLKYEKSHCNSKYAEKIIHSAKTDGDGLGFDILSFDDDGNRKYIEVKTTKGQVNRAFYISGTELARSKIEGDNYYLYRLFNFDENTMTADFIVEQGDLSKFCVNASEYTVVVKVSENAQ